MGNQQPSTSLDYIIKKKIEGAIKNSQLELSKKDIQQLASEILPDINLLISKEVKKHFVEIGQFIIDKYKEKE